MLITEFRRGKLWSYARFPDLRPGLNEYIAEARERQTPNVEFYCPFGVVFILEVECP